MKMLNKPILLVFNKRAPNNRLRLHQIEQKSLERMN